jgi:hypothetical protein
MDFPRLRNPEMRWSPAEHADRLPEDAIPATHSVHPIVSPTSRDASIFDIHLIATVPHPLEDEGMFRQDTQCQWFQRECDFAMEEKRGSDRRTCCNPAVPSTVYKEKEESVSVHSWTRRRCALLSLGCSTYIVGTVVSG